MPRPTPLQQACPRPIRLKAGRIGGKVGQPVNRAQHQRTIAEDRLRWTLLASAWMHFGVAVVLAWIRVPSPEARQVVPIQIIRPSLVSPRASEVVQGVSQRARAPRADVRPSRTTARNRAPSTAVAPVPRDPPPARRARRPQRFGGDTDPVASFQVSMGWTRKMPTGPSFRSPDAPNRPVPRSFEPADQLGRDSVLGRYVAELESLVAARWARLELPIRERASGIQGTVQVEYHIDRSGRIHDLRVTRSAGVLSLDRLALEAIPRRVPRIPQGVDRDTLVHRVSLRYDNPLLMANP